MNNNIKDIEGDDNTVVGIWNGTVKGSRNTVVGATDARGNTILNRPMIVGNNAKGGHYDIVIGSGAGAGSELFLLLDDLSKKEPDVADSIADLVSELKSTNRDKTKIEKLWDSIKGVVTVAESIQLVAKITALLCPILF